MNGGNERKVMFKKIKNAIAKPVAAAGLIALGGLSAHAQGSGTGGPDPTQIYTSVQTYFNAAAVIAITAIGIVMGIRYIKKGLRA
jgi:hypothetical protein